MGHWKAYSSVALESTSSDFNSAASRRVVRDGKTQGLVCPIPGASELSF